MGVAAPLPFGVPALEFPSREATPRVTVWFLHVGTQPRSGGAFLQRESFRKHVLHTRPATERALAPVRHLAIILGIVIPGVARRMGEACRRAPWGPSETTRGKPGDRDERRLARSASAAAIRDAKQCRHHRDAASRVAGDFGVVLGGLVRRPHRRRAGAHRACRSCPPVAARATAHSGIMDRTPTHGYEATREEAMAAFAKSWRRLPPRT
jgi:hypothetical protein